MSAWVGLRRWRVKKRTSARFPCFARHLLSLAPALFLNPVPTKMFRVSAKLSILLVLKI